MIPGTASIRGGETMIPILLQPLHMIISFGERLRAAEEQYRSQSCSKANIESMLSPHYCIKQSPLMRSILFIMHHAMQPFPAQSG